MASESDMYRQLANEVRKIAADQERLVMVKCATTLTAAVGLEVLRRKVSNG